MIDEKKIEEAAIKFAEKCSGDYIATSNSIEGFKAGINWFLDNLWHDGRETPQKETVLLVEYYGGVQYLFHLRCTKDCHFPNSGIKRWLYIDDLLKGGK